MVSIQHQRRRGRHSFVQGHKLIVFGVTLVIITVLIVYRYVRQNTSSDDDISMGIRMLRCNQFITKPYGCVLKPNELTDDVRKDVTEINNEIQKNPAASISVLYGDREKAGVTKQGSDHKFNQDRGLIVSPFLINNGESPSYHEHDKDTNFLIGIFDGHGDMGHGVSSNLQVNVPEYISKKIHNLLQNNNMSDDNMTKILKETYVELDQQLPHDLGYTGGSTASIILRVGDKIFFSNVGDSLSFLASYDSSIKETKIVHENRFDKAYIEEEKERIEKMGGKVFIPKFPMNARVVAYDATRNEHVSLGMSRAIGDWYHGKVGVIAEPIVDIIDLKKVKQPGISYFVISSCDGLYDHRQKQFIANHFGQCFYGSNDSFCHPVVESVNVIDLATPQRINAYHDDITIMSLKITL